MIQYIKQFFLLFIVIKSYNSFLLKLFRKRVTSMKPILFNDLIFQENMKSSRFAMKMQLQGLMSVESELIDLYEQRRESVVFISKLSQSFNPLQWNMMEIPSLSGSGFVWDQDLGYIVTNYHVVENQKEMLVTFVNKTNGNRESFRANLHGSDKDKDIAVLKLQLNNQSLILPAALPLGNSTSVRVGQYAIAIGNPFGLDQTLTSGIISGLGRQIRSSTGNIIFDMIQSDCSINPGNSGGPLLDSSGRLIGMNTAILTPSGAFSGVGLSIPVDTLKVVVSGIIKNGYFVKPKTGLELVGGYQARLLGIETGLLVVNVLPGSAAEIAGIRSLSKQSLLSRNDITNADIILQVNNMNCNTEADLLQATYNKSPGDIIELTLLRSLSTVSNNNKQKRDSRQVKVQLKLS